jgi:uncharacterized protein YjbI with pentapeptide repeats
MGKGANMKIANNRSDAVSVAVSSVQCMYDNGDQGSNLSRFNATIAGGGATLPSGNPQYIEVNASGSCWFDESYFTLTFKDPAGNVIGTVQIGENDNSYYTKNTPDTSKFNVTVTSGDQYSININVLHPAIPTGPAINQWILSCQNRVADIWYNQDYTVYGLNPTAGGQGPGSSNLVTVHDQGGGAVALQCGGGYNAYASVRDDWNYQVQFQAPGSAAWITQVNVNETLQVIPTGDGYFALYSPHFNRYIQINPNTNSKANNCNPLAATGTGLGSAARFSAAGQQRNSVFDLIQVAKSAIGMSFAGIDLAGKDLSNVNLTGCDFTQAKAVNACVFTGANLANAKLGGVTLDLAKLSGANCTGADFTSAVLASSAPPASPPVLAGANLTRAQIQGSLAGATLTGATLTGATVTSTADLTGANMSGASLSGAVLDGNLTKANLSDANLAQVNLVAQAHPALKLTGANLSGADLSHAVLPGADLSGTILAGTNFTGQDLSQVRFSTPLNQSTDPDKPTIFTDCILPYTIIGLNWSCLDLTGTTLTGLPTNLTGLNASGARRPNANFSSYTLDGANFTGATLDGAQFAGASLRAKANFSGARLVGAVFTSAVLDQASFRAAALGGVELSQAANLSYAYVSNCDFTGASLYGVNFAGATLVSENILRAGAAPGLQEADFSNAYLPDADFTGASLQGAKFDGAFMVSCVLDNADLSPTQQGAISASLTAACLQGVSFSNTKLVGANLANAAITNARGMISQQYYGENGQLTQSTEMRYQAGNFPAATSFSSQTMCPNDNTYGVNQANNLTIAQMMTAKNPPTSWAPKNTERPGAPYSAGGRPRSDTGS